jgi:hypothetical protein
VEIAHCTALGKRKPLGRGRWNPLIGFRVSRVILGIGITASGKALQSHNKQLQPTVMHKVPRHKRQHAAAELRR